MQSMSMKYAALVRNGEHTKLLQAFKEKTIIKFVRPKGASSSTQTKSHKVCDIKVYKIYEIVCFLMKLL